MKVCVYMTLFQLGGIDSYWKHTIAKRQDLTWDIFTNVGVNSPFPKAVAETHFGIFWKKPWQTSKALLTYLNRHKPDALVVNGTLADVLILPLLPILFWRGIKLIAVYHNSAIYPSRGKNIINRAVLSLLGYLRHANFFVSEAVAHYWLCNGAVNPIPIVPNPRMLSPKTQFTVAFIGRLSWEKGPDFFVEVMDRAVGLAAARGITIIPRVLGDGPMRAELKSESIIFDGWVADVKQRLETVDLLLITSRTEGFPMTVIECLEAGVPILGFDVGGVKEALGTAATDSLCTIGDTDKLATLTADFLANYTENYKNFFAKLPSKSTERFDQLWNAALARLR